ncbi:MAG: MmcQ/YjbR family DNA-binding protein [Emcibacteraceae bacterium]|nr:MmcQ/YjbR family DNA-binding protein [Emcibacteraceae bacterium]
MGRASVWKVGGKVFAIHPGENKDDHRISFKCSELNFQILKELPDIIPAPYLARGQWIQVTTFDAMNNQDVKDYINASYAIIAGKLTKKLREELGINSL